MDVRKNTHIHDVHKKNKEESGISPALFSFTSCSP